MIICKTKIYTLY